jgi:tetratricopeptide (TPR) repeat protein
MKLSLALIVAPTDDEARKLNNCLTSVGSFVDEVCVTITGKNKKVEEVCKRHNVKVSHFEWVDDFAAARNYNFSQCTWDWILWLDADDIVAGGEVLRENVEIAESVAVNGLQMFYEYGHDDNGTVIDGHWKTQLVKNDGSTHWVGAIHEDLIQKRMCHWAQIGRDKARRVHTVTKKENNEHFERNLRILEKERERNPEEPRTYIYLGRTYLGLNRFEDALKALSYFITTSGWDEERYEAKCLMGECYEKLGLRKEAYQAYGDALLEDERCPKAYVLKARLYFGEEKYKEALTLLHIARTLPDPKPGIMHLPTLLGRDLYMMASVCCLNLGKNHDAHEYAKLAEKEDKHNKHVQELLKVTTKMSGDESMTKTFVTLLKWYQVYEPSKVDAVYDIIPNDIKDDPRLLSLVVKKKVWDKDSIVIYCGPTAEAWLPGSENTKGIGGSETAVIELAKRLVMKGWNVTVYNQCNSPAQGTTVDGVLYKNYWQFNKDDEFDVLWLWRQPSLLQIQWKTRKLILDLHDVPNEAEFTPERIARVDKIFVKTNYHRNLLPSVPDEKFVIVGNGIDLTRFDQEVERNPKKIIYSSAPNRGLENLLEIWSDVRKEVPDAELHVFYGWETFFALQKDNPAAMEWMQNMQRKLQQPGVITRGRVGQKELAKEMLSSSLWVYMTEFPEIHCITACEMQAAGVWAVTTGFAALEEVQQSGMEISGDPKTEKVREMFKDEIIHRLTNEVYRDDIKEVAKQFDWDEVANTWDHELR